MSPATGRGAGISPEEVENALLDAKEVMTTINISKTWEGALARIKWVMDTLNPVAEVRYKLPFPIFYQSEFRPQLHPYAKMAYGLLFAIPKVICLRYCQIQMLMFIWILRLS